MLASARCCVTLAYLSSVSDLLLATAVHCVRTPDLPHPPSTCGQGRRVRLAARSSVPACHVGARAERCGRLLVLHTRRCRPDVHFGGFVDVELSTPLGALGPQDAATLQASMSVAPSQQAKGSSTGS